jgi:light-regulated signal transduction histidine kinase (bacteriophytochrome)
VSAQTFDASGHALALGHAVERIQPHGVLLAVVDPLLTIAYASANAADLFGFPVERILGSSLKYVLSGEQVELVTSALGPDPRFAGGPFALKVGNDARDVVCSVHGIGGAAILEFEFERAAPTVTNAQLVAALSSVERASSVDDLAHRVAVEVKHLTGFDCVAVSRLDEHDAPELLAEERSSNLPPEFDSTFAVDDVLVAARDVPMLDPVYAIADVTATAIPVVAAAGLSITPSLDLSRSHLRSPNPRHADYLRGMNVASSMTISIVVGRKLWGFVACYNVAPRILDSSTRSTCALLGRIVNAHAALREVNAELRFRMSSRRVLEQYMTQVDGSSGLPQGEYFDERKLRRLMKADALVAKIDGSTSSYGTPIAVDAVASLAAALRLGARRGMADTNVLGDVSVAVALPAPFGGALYLELSENDEYLLLLRRSSAHTSNASMWHEVELSNAYIVREQVRRLLEADRRQASERDIAHLQAINEELESYSYSISHDLRSPARAMIGFSRAIQEDHADQLDDEGLRLLSVVSSEAQRMGTLIDDLLRFSQLNRDSTRLSNVDMGKLARSVFAEQQALTSHPAAIAFYVLDVPTAYCDEALVRQVWTNLISNAVKYSRKSKSPLIEIWGESDETGNVYHVRDNGVGFDMRYADKLFGVFQRMHSDTDFPGNGVGLAIVKRIVGRHGGLVWADSTPGAGTTLSFSLPAQKEDA